jgi:hypothetical protein
MLVENSLELTIHFRNIFIVNSENSVDLDKFRFKYSIFLLQTIINILSELLYILLAITLNKWLRRDS